MASDKKLRTAVIGGGNMGKNHVRNYYLLTQSDLVGLADVNPATEKLADEYDAKFYTDYVQMLDELRPDAVSIVVPTSLHFAVAKTVIERGIHCMLEKPIASTVDEAEELIKLAKKHKVVFTVGHIEHYNPLVVALKKLLVKGSVGEVTSIVCTRVGGFPLREPKTGVITDLGIHDIGIMNYLLGKTPKSVLSHASQTHHSQHNDSAEFLLDYGTASGFVQTNWLTPVKVRTITVTGSKGYISGNYITQELELYTHNIQRETDDFDDFVVKMGEPKKEMVRVNFEEPLQKELGSFLDHINGHNGEYLVSPDEAKEALGAAIKAENAKVSIS